MSNERDIRLLTKEYLSKKFKNCSIHEEFGVFLDSRNDVMGITWNDIISLEIKSNKDTFARLEKQLNTYSSFSTLVYVVLDIIHLEKYEKEYFNQFKNVGILVYQDEKLNLYYEPTRLDFVSMYSLLTSQELIHFFDWFKGKSLIPKDRKTSDTLIKDIFTEDEIFNISKHIFLTRFISNVSRTPLKKYFKNFKKANDKFTEWLDESNWNMYVSKPFNWVQDNKKIRAKRSSLKCNRKVKVEYE